MRHNSLEIKDKEETRKLLEALACPVCSCADRTDLIKFGPHYALCKPDAKMVNESRQAGAWWIKNATVNKNM